MTKLHTSEAINDTIGEIIFWCKVEILHSPSDGQTNNLKGSIKGFKRLFFSDNITNTLNLETSMNFLNSYKFLMEKKHDPNI